MGVALLLRRGREAPAPVGSTEERIAGLDDEDGALVCIRCGRLVTTRGARIAMSGAHEHTRTNPYGFVFRIGCFAIAPGCALGSDPSTEFSWFPGYAWQVEICSSCGEHLGWRFGREESVFHGLILDRLVESRRH